MQCDTSIQLNVAGEFALFPRPEFHRDEVTYDVLTPAAARGILDRIHWRPAIRWIVDAIQVVRPICFEDTSAPDATGRTGRRRVVLRDVEYVIHAHFEMTERAGVDDDPAGHRGMFRRWARQSPTVHLGRPEFPARTRLLDEQGWGSPHAAGMTRDLGWMVHDSDFADRRRLRFFRARMIDGLIAVPPPGSAELYG